jgi:hypothetical protein
MNIAILKSIEVKTESSASYSTDDKGVTTYSLTKPINGKLSSVKVVVTPELHASSSADVVAELVFQDAAKQFAALRKHGESNKEAK